MDIVEAIVAKGGRFLRKPTAVEEKQYLLLEPTSQSVKTDLEAGTDTGTGAGSTSAWRVVSTETARQKVAHSLQYHQRRLPQFKSSSSSSNTISKQDQQEQEQEQELHRDQLKQKRRRVGKFPRVMSEQELSRRSTKEIMDLALDEMNRSNLFCNTGTRTPKNSLSTSASTPLFEIIPESPHDRQHHPLQSQYPQHPKPFGRRVSSDMLLTTTPVSRVSFLDASEEDAPDWIPSCLENEGVAEDWLEWRSTPASFGICSDTDISAATVTPEHTRGVLMMTPSDSIRRPGLYRRTPYNPRNSNNATTLFLLEQQRKQQQLLSMLRSEADTDGAESNNNNTDLTNTTGSTSTSTGSSTGSSNDEDLLDTSHLQFLDEHLDSLEQQHNAHCFVVNNQERVFQDYVDSGSSLSSTTGTSTGGGCGTPLSVGRLFSRIPKSRSFPSNSLRNGVGASDDWVVGQGQDAGDLMVDVATSSVGVDMDTSVPAVSNNIRYNTPVRSQERLSRMLRDGFLMPGSGLRQDDRVFNSSILGKHKSRMHSQQLVPSYARYWHSAGFFHQEKNLSLHNLFHMLEPQEDYLDPMIAVQQKLDLESQILAADRFAFNSAPGLTNRNLRDTFLQHDLDQPCEWDHNNVDDFQDFDTMVHESQANWLHSAHLASLQQHRQRSRAITGRGKRPFPFVEADIHSSCQGNQFRQDSQRQHERASTPFYGRPLNRGSLSGMHVTNETVGAFRSGFKEQSYAGHALQHSNCNDGQGPILNDALVDESNYQGIEMSAGATGMSSWNQQPHSPHEAASFQSHREQDFTCGEGLEESGDGDEWFFAS